MNLRVTSLVLACASLVSAAGCSGGKSAGDGGPSPQAYTVSYRSQVRLPAGGASLAADAFAAQVRADDPIAATRCAPDDSPAFRDITQFLGGIAWGHPVAIVKDASLPPLYDGKHTNYAEASAGAAADSPAPSISRPDLVGISSGIAVFLSAQHGLLAVDARGDAPIPSCAMKLPGEPKNFLVHGTELVAIVNARGGGGGAALLRYSFGSGALSFVDAVRLEDQTIEDARLFDATIVAYTSWSKPAPAVAPSGPSSGQGTGAVTGGAMGAPAQVEDRRLGAKVLVVQWGTAPLKLDWQDSLLDDPIKRDPFEGTVPGAAYTPGQLISQRRTYARFVSASDRYVVVPRASQATRFSHYETYSYEVCTNYNPQYEQVQSCHVNYERRDNPDYKAPDPTTGDYACNGKSLADCIQAAAPVVSRYVYVPVGQSCEMLWQGRCMTYETRTTTYPRFDTTSDTEMIVYRFEGGAFTKLDAQLATMTAKAGAINFATGPLSVKGSVATRNQIQFQNGQLYVLADGALQTLAVAGSSISYLNRLAIPSSTSGAPSIAFSPDRAMISSATYPQSSQVTMLDLSSPAQPSLSNAFTMPGQSTQLILASGGILGPGQVSFAHAQVERRLEKLTLFSKVGGQELDNLLLGTEFDTLESSWLDASDDQRIRLGAGGARLFLPYSGQHQFGPYAPTAHRLSITRVDADRLVSERSFEVSDDVVRTADVDDQRALVFASSATYLVDHRSGDWALSTVREVFVPFATYRFDDRDFYARVSRVGSKCRVTTHAGVAAIFGDDHLAQADLTCAEGALPIGFGANLLFAGTRTGVRLVDGGRSLEQLSTDEVAALLAKVPSSSYCYIPGASTENGAPVDFLDAVPAQILCEAF